jgi:hypothetical protein
MPAIMSPGSPSLLIQVQLPQTRRRIELIARAKT